MKTACYLGAAWAALASLPLACRPDPGRLPTGPADAWHFGDREAAGQSAALAAPAPAAARNAERGLVTAALLRGELAPDQAADRFRELNAEAPAALARLRRRFPAATDEELAHYQLVRGTLALAAHDRTPASAEAAARLLAAYRERFPAGPDPRHDWSSRRVTPACPPPYAPSGANSAIGNAVGRNRWCLCGSGARRAAMASVTPRPRRTSAWSAGRCRATQSAAAVPAVLHQPVGVGQPRGEVVGRGPDGGDERGLGVEVGHGFPFPPLYPVGGRFGDVREGFLGQSFFTRVRVKVITPAVWSKPAGRSPPSMWNETVRVSPSTR